MSENNLKHWQDKIKEKRKQTDFRDFLMEIASWFTFVLYKHTGETSIYPVSDRIKKVVNFKDFDNNGDDLLKNGKDINESNTFFENFSELSQSIDYFNIISYGGNENSDFANMVLDSNNVYLSCAIINSCENIFYSISVKDNSSSVFNSLSIWSNCEHIYFGVGVLNSFKIYYSRFINNSNNIWFSTNLNGCSECIGCNDLENCSYYINNKKYSKEEYLIEKSIILKDKKSFFSTFNSLEKKGNNINSNNVTGSGIFNSQNVENGYFSYNINNGRNLILTGGVDGNENMYDVFPGGAPSAYDFYGVMGANGNNIYCSLNVVRSSNIFYSSNCKGSSYCIGCIGLKNKSYCILNKQYSKEEWYKRADEIFSRMDGEGTLGDFFPGELNPFNFNDTIAGLIGGFTKQEVIAKGYMWRDEEIKVDIPEGLEVIGTEKLDDFQGYDANGNWKINPEILAVVIKDEKGNYYRIIQEEYDFLVKHGLPIPEIHWMDRMKLNFGM